MLCARGQAERPAPLLLLMLCCVAIALPSLATAPDGERCHTLWLVNVVRINAIYGAVDVDDLSLSLPANYSDDTYSQTAYLVRYGGDTELKGSKLYIRPANGSTGFYVARVEVCSPGPAIAFSAFMEAAESATANFSVPVADPIVATKVRGEFEAWLASRNVSAESLGPLRLAIEAARFVYYSGYIRYQEGLLPRTLNETLSSKAGDCDDMARVLMNLLWSYGIPAKIEGGLVYLRGFELPTELSNSTMLFINGGPHAYVVAYTPPVGWVALDLLGRLLNNPLAGSRYYYPFIIMGHSMERDVDPSELEELLEFLERVKFSEVIAVFNSSDLVALGGVSGLIEHAFERLSTIAPPPSREDEPPANATAAAAELPADTPIAATTAKTTPITNGTAGPAPRTPPPSDRYRPEVGVSALTPLLMVMALALLLVAGLKLRLGDRR